MHGVERICEGNDPFPTGPAYCRTASVIATLRDRKLTGREVDGDGSDETAGIVRLKSRERGVKSGHRTPTLLVLSYSRLSPSETSFFLTFLNASQPIANTAKDINLKL